MKYIVFSKNSDVVHCQSGIAKSKNIVHIKRTMPMTELMLMCDGELHISHLENYILHENDIFFLPQNVLHYGTQSDTFEIHWIHFILPSDFRIAEEGDLANVDFESNIVLPMLLNSDDIQRLFAFAYQLEQYPETSSTQDVRNSLVKTMLYDIMLRHVEFNRPTLLHKRLNSILNYINSNIDKQLVVKDLSNHFGYNEKYIFTLFKQYLNISPLKYITRQKMDFAKNLLLSTENTIEAISYELGYDNPQYFMRLFKRTFNCTPTEYRKTYSHSLELFLSPKQEN